MDARGPIRRFQSSNVALPHECHMLRVTNFAPQCGHVHSGLTCFIMTTCAGFTNSTDGDRSDRRAGAALYLQWLEHQRELVRARGGKLAEPHVLEEMDAVHHEHDLVG